MCNKSSLVTLHGIYFTWLTWLSRQREAFHISCYPVVGVMPLELSIMSKNQSIIFLEWICDTAELCLSSNIDYLAFSSFSNPQCIAPNIMLGPIPSTTIHSTHKFLHHHNNGENQGLLSNLEHCMNEENEERPGNSTSCPQNVSWPNSGQLNHYCCSAEITRRLSCLGEFSAGQDPAASRY